MDVYAQYPQTVGVHFVTQSKEFVWAANQLTAKIITSVTSAMGALLQVRFRLLPLARLFLQ